MEGDSLADTVLVTGGSRFIAGWCIVELLERGFDVRTTVRSPRSRTECGPRSLARSAATPVTV
jgi:nucleoside-diphosphate-sugar epimerase